MKQAEIVIVNAMRNTWNQIAHDMLQAVGEMSIEEVREVVLDASRVETSGYLNAEELAFYNALSHEAVDALAAVAFPDGPSWVI